MFFCKLREQVGIAREPPWYLLHTSKSEKCTVHLLALSISGVCLMLVMLFVFVPLIINVSLIINSVDSLTMWKLKQHFRFTDKHQQIVLVCYICNCESPFCRHSWVQTFSIVLCTLCNTSMYFCPLINCRDPFHAAVCVTEICTFKYGWHNCALGQRRTPLNLSYN